MRVNTSSWLFPLVLLILLGGLVACAEAESGTIQPLATLEGTPSSVSGWIDVGDYRLYYECIGTGTPTVILEAGWGDVGETWYLVQPEVAKYTQACAYDRVGLGRSDPGPEPPTSLYAVRDLHALLEGAGIASPYILVGHSLVGMYMLLFADRYPDEVVGLILVDSSHPESFGRSAAVLPPETPGESESLRFYREW